ncbi:MAG: mechanosensitive ion channel family protein [Saprospiraceae bacterium]|nr:mechanosensitive ion channel family protein [Saprospiraceae bacterium]MCF8249638.1 mechanosensitive ion channel family protein [Saprospiraceae bacterium]MCF8280448.1 mechanosensitive ion channel family protein [Bacteroidales bacterium]MCF8310470.1 mechanosensitive ion channel family protein [Saprospiraceae bacterium]MCF8439848.1 mechanosensitive ion channel family protein [Saprospiraceae bacterium]
MARFLFIFLKYLALFALIYLKVRSNLWKGDFNLPLNINSEHLLGITNILLNFLILLLGLNLLKIGAVALYRRRQNLPADRPDNVMVGIENIYILLTTAVVLIAFLSFFGIDIKSLFTGLTIVAAAIAIITKDYIANIISGISISFSDEISIGDYVKIAENKGKVMDISISRIALLNDDDDTIFIPNDTVFTSNIINYTKKGIRKVSIEFEMNLTFLDTIEELENDLIECLCDHHGSIEEGSFELKIVEIKKDSLDLKFQYTLKSINRELERDIRRKTVRRVVNHIGKK